ncbi:MAG: hypothetical protein AAFR61_16370 [Bacteroidota bacterium]
MKPKFIFEKEIEDGKYRQKKTRGLIPWGESTLALALVIPGLPSCCDTSIQPSLVYMLDIYLNGQIKALCGRHKGFFGKYLPWNPGIEGAEGQKAGFVDFFRKKNPYGPSNILPESSLNPHTCIDL